MEAIRKRKWILKVVLAIAAIALLVSSLIPLLVTL
jgi:hypothetical protein